MKENHYLKIASNEVADIEDLKDYRKDIFSTVSSSLKWGLSFLGTMMVGLLYVLLKAIETQNTDTQLIVSSLLVLVAIIFLRTVSTNKSFLRVIENEYLLYLEAKKLIRERKTRF